MKTYQKKLDLVEAIQVTDENLEALLGMEGVQAVGEGVYAVATGLGEKTLVHPGEWIVERQGKGVVLRSLMGNAEFTNTYQEVN